jgi:hypothetical protein
MQREPRKRDLWGGGENRREENGLNQNTLKRQITRRTAGRVSGIRENRLRLLLGKYRKQGNDKRDLNERKLGQEGSDFRWSGRGAAKPCVISTGHTASFIDRLGRGGFIRTL